jgi:hypothetical protein
VHNQCKVELLLFLFLFFVINLIFIHKNSISFLKRSQNVFFVLPSFGQAETFERQIVGNKNKERMVDLVSSHAALSLMSCSQTHIITSSED